MQTEIQAMLDSLVLEGKEYGIQVAAYVDGKLIVNSWAGFADIDSRRPVDEQTLFPIFSTTKGIAATVIHILAEQGKLSYNEAISTYWPEFAAHGKDKTTVRHALFHAAGIPQMPRGIEFADLGDWDGMCRRVADLEPLWRAGSRIDYHAVTYGWIVGEVARRVTGTPFQQLLAESICAPLGIESLYIGTPNNLDRDIATLYEPGAGSIEDDGLPQSISWWLWPLHVWMNRPESLRACNPASTGVANALSIARHYAALLPGGVDGVELLPPHRVRVAAARQVPEYAEADDYRRDRALGYEIGHPDSPLQNESAFGHGGYGGSIGMADPDLGLAVGITKNLLNQHDTSRVVLDEIRRNLS